jgi:hypothetical protein
VTIHRQRKIAGIFVDAKLAEMLGYLWAKGIKTSFSCQGGLDGLGYIQFLDLASGVHFYNLLANPTEPMFFTEWHCHQGQVVLIARFSDHGRKLMLKKLRKLAG